MTPNHNDLMNERRKHAGDVPTQTCFSNLSELMRKLKTATGAQARHLKKMIRLNVAALEGKYA